MLSEHSPAPLIAATRVTGTAVFNTSGERIGHIEDLSIHKVSGQTVYAILSFGGFLGIGEQWHPLPWSILRYDPEQHGYVVPLDKAAIEAAPALTREELDQLGLEEPWGTRIFEYYGAYGAYGAAPFV